MERESSSSIHTISAACTRRLLFGKASHGSSDGHERADSNFSCGSRQRPSGPQNHGVWHSSQSAQLMELFPGNPASPAAASRREGQRQEERHPSTVPAASTSFSPQNWGRWQPKIRHLHSNCQRSFFVSSFCFLLGASKWKRTLDSSGYCDSIDAVYVECPPFFTVPPFVPSHHLVNQMTVFSVNVIKIYHSGYVSEYQLFSH